MPSKKTTAKNKKSTVNAEQKDQEMLDTVTEGKDAEAQKDEASASAKVSQKDSDKSTSATSDEKKGEEKSQEQSQAVEKSEAPKMEEKTKVVEKVDKNLKTSTTYPSVLENGVADKPVNTPFKARVIVVTSGKGGVGKTTTAAAISSGLAMKGHKTAVIDFDVGLRNLDIILGCERRVVYDLINVIQNEASLNQALIKDRHAENLYILPASQNKDKEALTLWGVGNILKQLDEMGFEYIICDSPAGIETGALMALYYADEAIVTTNPEISSVRDSDRIIGILHAKSRRSINGWDDVTPRLLITRYAPGRVAKNEMLSINDIDELLTIPLVGVIPESADVLKASNEGISIIHDTKSDAAQAYLDTVDRLLGEEVELRFTTEEKSFFSKLFRK